MGTSDLSQDIASASTPQSTDALASAAGAVEARPAGSVEARPAGAVEARPAGSVEARPAGAVETRAAQVFRRRVFGARGTLLLPCDGVAVAIAGLLVGPGWSAVGYSVAVLAALNVLGTHRRRICMRVSDEVPRLAAAAALPLLLLSPRLDSLATLLTVGLVTATLLVTMRGALYASMRAAYRANRLTEPVLIVGTGKLGLEVGELLLEHPDLGLRPVGLVGETTPASGPSLPVLGGLSRISDVVREHGVSKIIVSLPAETDENMVSTLRAECPSSVDLYLVPPMPELASAVPASCMDEVWGIPLLPLRLAGIHASGRMVKRAFDLLVGTVLVVALAPVLLILVTVGFLAGSRPVLFRQERVTRSGRIMTIMKLRTMSCPNPDSQWTVPAENCSATGRWLRATHLDELPQLFNVIRGDMSLVGPRPERPFFVSKFARIVPHYDQRHRTRAGLTGWAQVHGLTGDTSIPERTRFDNYYIEHWSLWLDLVIMTRTIAEPLIGALRARQPRARRQDARW
jgi:exopolysaccharide biosynthesis polyprenyl glycosylphosphotransferase